MNYLKILGAVLVSIAFAFFGIYKSNEIKKGLNKLISYMDFLQNLRKQMYFFNYTLDEMFENLNEDFSKYLKDKTMITKYFSNEQDKKNMLIFFDNLGRTDREEQLLSIDYNINLCKQRIDEEKEKYREKARVNIIFYAFLGLAVTLVLC